MSLIDVLKRCRNLASVSQDSVWSSRGTSEIVVVLNGAIVAIESGSQPNRDELILLFAPTGDLQETAMANGWAEEYQLLSARFDELIE